MLEVLIASVGSGIAGAAKGYASSFKSKYPARLYGGTLAISIIGFNEAVRYKERREKYIH